MINEIINFMNENKYPISTENDFVNIVGVRSQDKDSNEFNDTMYVIRFVDGKMCFNVFPMTTDPGLSFRLKPTSWNSYGVAILKEGHYHNAWCIGNHRGYLALVQIRNVMMYVDVNRDSKLDFLPETIRVVEPCGINIHRANKNFLEKLVNRYSAGCQVVQDYNDYFWFMTLCFRHKKKHGNEFSYTLINEEDLRKD